MIDRESAHQIEGVWRSDLEIAKWHAAAELNTLTERPDDVPEEVMDRLRIRAEREYLSPGINDALVVFYWHAYHDGFESDDTVNAAIEALCINNRLDLFSDREIAEYDEELLDVYELVHTVLQHRVGQWSELVAEGNDGDLHGGAIILTVVDQLSSWFKQPISMTDAADLMPDIMQLANETLDDGEAFGTRTYNLMEKLAPIIDETFRFQNRITYTDVRFPYYGRQRRLVHQWAESPEDLEHWKFKNRYTITNQEPQIEEE